MPEQMPQERPEDPGVPMSPEEVQAEASKVAHERLEGLQSFDIDEARQDLRARKEASEQQEAERKATIAENEAKRKRMDAMDKWARAQGKIAEERAAAARKNESDAVSMSAETDNPHTIDRIGAAYRTRNKDISDMNHHTGSTMTSTIYGKPTVSGDISQFERSDMDPNHLYPSGGRTGSREPLLSPKNMVVDQDQQEANAA